MNRIPSILEKLDRLVQQQKDSCTSQHYVHSQEQLEADMLSLEELEQELLVTEKEAGLRVPGATEVNERVITAFTQWVKEADPSSNVGETIEIKQCAEGCGVFALHDIARDDVLFQVPATLAFSTDSFLESGLSVQADQSRVVQQVPSVQLALQQACEMLVPSSYWTPYFDILPRQLDLPLFRLTSELNRDLGKSGVYYAAQRQKKNVLYQFCEVCRVLSHATTAFPQLNQLSYTLYRWCVGTVMARQNNLPGDALGLLPVFDMANHALLDGIVTTRFDSTIQAFITSSSRDWKQGQQVSMFYGPRGNAQLVLYMGFAQPDNPFNSTDVILPTDCAKDELLPARVQLARDLYLQYSGILSVKADNWLECKLLFWISSLPSAELLLKAQKYQALCLKKHPVRSKADQPVLYTAVLAAFNPAQIDLGLKSQISQYITAAESRAQNSPYSTLLRDEARSLQALIQ